MPSKQYQAIDTLVLQTGGGGITTSAGVTVVDGDGNIDAPVTTTDLTTTGNTTIGNASTDTLTVNASLVSNLVMVKESAHSLSVNDSTTANTAGGAASLVAGKGTGTAAGGAVNVTSGASSNGTAVSPGASGAVNVKAGAAGTATTGTAGAAGTVTVGGTAGGASTGASSVAGAGSDVAVTGGAGGASSGGGDTGGRGGNVVLTSGAGGTGATAGLAGGIFARGPVYRKYTSTAMTDTATISTAAILGGIIKGTPTAAAAYTTPTGAVLAAALPAAFTTGDSVDVTICNVATNDTFDITFTAGASGITLLGNVVVEANSATTKVSQGTFRFLCTGANTFDVYRIA